MRNGWVLLAIVPLSAVPALADITNQSVNATLNGSASVTVRCDSCPGGVGGGSGSFGVPVDSFGTFSGSATAAFTDPGSGRTLSITVESQETSEATSNGFDVDLTQDALVEAVGAESGGMLLLNDFYTLSFTVPTTAVMHLTGANNLVGGLTPVAALTGPSNFDFPISFGSVDDLLTLDPGDYQLMSHAPCMVGVSPPPQPEQLSCGELSLHADFAPAVPEPWGAPVIVIALAAVIAARRRAAHSTKAPAA